MMKTKYPRTMHFPFSPGATSDDRIIDDYSFMENTDIVITEKLDGQNNAICRGGVYARSHGLYSRLPWDKEVWNIHRRVGHQLDDETYIFGENMYAIHSIEYRRLTSYFYVFGVRICSEWLSWSDTKQYAEILELPTVPELFIGKTCDLKLKVLDLLQEGGRLEGIDTISENACTEGVVVRISDAFTESSSAFSSILKYVRENHVKTDKHWTKLWRRATVHWS